ncbi:MAG: hypothetical protein QM778_10205 [Myxococcales bacterium]
MSAGDPESWARLRLAQGESTALNLELTGSAGGTTLTVGQSPGCDWIVREIGVAPVHFSLHWDGSVLRIADVYGAGGVRMDGILVGAQWRALTGRVRIDFGKAAIVVETGAAVQPAPQGKDRKDPTPLPPMSSERLPSARPTAKATLLGVAPIDAASLPPHLRASVNQDEAEQSGQRPHKATLLGISEAPPPASSPSARPRPSVPATPSTPAPAGRSGPPPNQTLMGVGLGVALPGGRRVGGGSLGDEDQRTIQGFPHQQAEARGSAPEPSVEPAGRERRSTQQGYTPVAPASVAAPAPAPSQRPPASGSYAPPAPSSSSYAPPAPASGSYAPPPAAASGQPWHETPGPSSHRPPTGQIVREPVGRAVHQSEHSRAPAPRHADARGREPQAFESRRPKHRFPWRYVGVGALTAVAYFAWLYLLDHL